MNHKIGALRVDLAATCSRNEAGASSGVRRDTRSILYTNEFQSHHRFVHLQRVDQDPIRWTFAELRPSADGSNRASVGLLASLAPELDVSTFTLDADCAMTVEVWSTDDEELQSTCRCATGLVTSLRVHFASRLRPRRSIVDGLQRIVGMLLHGEAIWDQRSSRVDWMNAAELVEFNDVHIARSSGCCTAIGVCDSSTQATLSFANDASNTPMRSLQSVEEYTEQVAQSLGGIEDHAKRLITAILARFCPIKSSPLSVGAILSGLPGIGKTVLAKAICDALGVHVRFLSAAGVFQTFVGHSEAQIVKTFEELAQHAPSILVVDGLESVASTRKGFLDSDNTLEVGVLGTFVSCLDKLKLSDVRVFVLGTTSRIDDVDAAVYSNGRMDLIVRMEPPSQANRVEILSRIVRGWSLETTVSDQIQQLSESTGGYVGADLLSMCQKALQTCINDPLTDLCAPMIRSRHFDEALSTTYPSVLQAHHVSLRQGEKKEQKEDSDLFAMYGVDEALKTIYVSLLEPLQDCSRFLEFGSMPPKGILLTGPPGSGKTHLANAVAGELRRRGLASFISVRCTDLLTKVVGDTEKALRELFETARSAAPCVIYFDQIESIAPVRGFDTSTEQTFDRLLSMLLVEMDGFSTTLKSLERSVRGDEARNAFLKQLVVILASTNEKQQLDPAILRPGRFDVHIELDLPSRDARVQIFLDAAKRVPIDFTADQELSSIDRLSEYVADQTAGFSAGDLTSLLREAAMASMRDQFDVLAIAPRYVRDALQQHRAPCGTWC